MITILTSIITICCLLITTVNADLTLDEGEWILKKLKEIEVKMIEYRKWFAGRVVELDTQSNRVYEKVQKRFLDIKRRTATRVEKIVMKDAKNITEKRLRLIRLQDYLWHVCREREELVNLNRRWNTRHYITTAVKPGYFNDFLDDYL
jgi:hypothetical protein